MADLDFTHNVSEIPAGQTLPQPYHREVGVETTAFPDLQASINNYADSTNWMSAIGSSIATSAATASAQKIGSELGKNPQGNIGIPITNFDKTMQDSYNTQSQATLGLQANKLISDSNIELAKLPRLSPDTIANTQKSISSGLKNIISQAPDGVKENLESHYGNVQLDQTSSLTDRMIREQKEDQRNNTIFSSSTMAENAYSFGLNGNDKAALKTIETVKNLNAASVASNNGITPEQAKEHVDTVRRSYLTGKVNGEYEKQRLAGKGEAYLKSLADKKPSYISDADYPSVMQNVMQHVNQQDALRKQDEQLRLAQFKTSVALNPNSPDIPAQLNDLKANVTPEEYETAQLHYINTLRDFNNKQGNVQNALTSWNDPEAFSRLSDKAIDKGFDLQTTRYIQQHQDKGTPITRDDAEVQVALSAGGKVPVFIKSLNNKAMSGNPASILSAATQIQALRDLEGGHALEGLSKPAEVLTNQFIHQRGSMPDNDLARKLTDNITNVDSSMQQTLDNSWNLTLSTKGARGLAQNKSLGDYALREVGLLNKNLGGKYFNTVYGNDIYSQLYSNFIASRGDYDTAVKMTKDYVDTHYGETRVNGDSQISDSPIEKVLGYKDRNVVPAIQQDILNQLSIKFNTNKDPNDYWTTEPLKSNNGYTFPAAEVTRHIKTDKGVKEYRYPVNIIGRPGNEWDVVVQTPTGPRNLFLVAPHVGIATYKPNAIAIRQIYSAHLTKKGIF
jgi:hypothetical protein